MQQGIIKRRLFCGMIIFFTSGTLGIKAVAETQVATTKIAVKSCTQETSTPLYETFYYGYGESKTYREGNLSNQLCQYPLRLVV